MENARNFFVIMGCIFVCLLIFIVGFVCWSCVLGNAPLEDEIPLTFSDDKNEERTDGRD